MTRSGLFCCLWCLANLMFDQLFTDDVMFAVSLVTFCVVSMILIAFLRRDSWRSLWWILCLAYLIPHLLLTAGYFVLWRTPETPTLLFPTVAILTRPGLTGIYAFVILSLLILFKRTEHDSTFR